MLEHRTDSSPGSLNEWLSHSAKGVHSHRRPSQSAVYSEEGDRLSDHGWLPVEGGVEEDSP